MSHFEQVASGLDVAGLVAQIHANPHLWGEHSQRLRVTNSPHADSQDIWVRYRDAAELTEPARFIEPHISMWYPCARVLKGAPAIARVLMSHPSIEGERLGGVLITRLPPGARIKPHVDHGWHAATYEKFYVALQNAPGSVFGWKIGDIHAATGDVWWFRNDVPHWVNNDSDTDRLSMIVCIKTPYFDRHYESAAA